MPIQMRCGGCGKQYTVQDDWAGKTVRCKGCGTVLRIPMPSLPVAEPVAQAPEAVSSSPDPLDDLFGDLPAAPSPVAASGSALTPVRPKKRRSSGLPPAGDSILSFIRSDLLNTAVAIGMGIVLIASLVLLVTSGISGGLIANGLVFVGGFVIIVGGMRKVRRNRDAVGARTSRVAAWFAGGILGIVVSLGGAMVAGKSGIPVQSVAIVASPLVAVFAIVTLISGMILAYNILVFVFPNLNVFRVAGWFYVFLTVVVPALGLLAGMALKSAAHKLADMDQEAEDSVQERSDERREAMNQQMEDMQRRGQQRLADMKARTSLGGDTSFEGRVQSLHDRFGSERVAELHMEFVPPEKGRSLYQHIMQLAGVGNGVWSNRGNPVTMVLAPIDDLQALADLIDFGEVLNIDSDARSIQIQVDPDKL